MVSISARGRLELKRARLALLLAAPAAGEQIDARERAREIAAVEAEISELQLEAGELFRLPPRRDIDGDD